MSAPQPQGPVQPEPINETFIVDQATMPDGREWVVLQILSPNGTHVSFLPPAFAKGLAARLEQQATQASTGLILPPGVNGHRR